MVKVTYDDYLHLSFLFRDNFHYSLLDLFSSSLVIWWQIHPITTNSICFKNSITSIIFLLTHFTALTCFSYCSSIKIPMPKPFFFSSAALNQYPVYFLFVL